MWCLTPRPPETRRPPGTGSRSHHSGRRIKSFVVSCRLQKLPTRFGRDEISRCRTFDHGWRRTVNQRFDPHQLQAMYTDAGYVTEHTLTQAEQNGIELLGPTRPDPHKGPYNTDWFHVDVEKRQAVCPQGKLSTQCSRIKDSYMGTEYTASSGAINVTVVRYKTNVRVPTVAGER